MSTSTGERGSLEDFIPVIDLEDYIQGQPEALDRVATQFRRASERVGFLVIINHGVYAEEKQRVMDVARRFFDLPLAEKMKIRINDDAVGYMPDKAQLPRTSTWYKGSKKPDRGEAFMMKRDWSNDYTGFRNQWPDQPPDFKDVTRPWFDRMEELSLVLLPVYARALDLEENYFLRFFRRGKALNMLRLARMPADRLEPDEFNVAAHSDSSFVTLLPISDQRGLQVMTRKGDWIDVPRIENSFVVNSGDMLTRWSNGRFLSTPHRVINTSGKLRYSIPFFCHPEPDAVIECLDTCMNPGNPPKDPPISCAAYLDWFMHANFALGEATYAEAERG